MKNRMLVLMGVLALSGVVIGLTVISPNFDGVGCGPAPRCYLTPHPQPQTTAVSVVQEGGGACGNTGQRCYMMPACQTGQRCYL